MAQSSSSSVVYAALTANLAIAATKFAAALWTGSSAMLSEAIHSAVDTSNQALLLWGMRRSARPPDASHPFGHGMEIYFWGFVVALLIFSLGGAVSVYQGIHHITEPQPMENGWINIAVLCASAVFEGLSFRVAWREMKARYPALSPFAAMRTSKDPSVFAVMLEDLAALAGIAIAIAGVTLAITFEEPLFDGIASLLIGGLLIMAAVFLSRETLSLMTGESASRETLQIARKVISADPRVETVEELLSFHLGPRDILLAVAIDFDDALTAAELENTARCLTARLQREHPAFKRVYLKPVVHKKAPAQEKAAQTGRDPDVA